VNGEHIVQLMRDAVVPGRRPAVFLSGGLDSTILLHHLHEKVEEPIRTYTAYWGTDDDETKYARELAEIYGTKHTEVHIQGIFEMFKKLLPHVDRPHRFNLWPAFLYEAAAADLCENVYVAEGPDEHFGGYWYKEPATYQEYWSGVLEYSVPTHAALSSLYGVKLNMPFIRLDIRETLPYYDYKHRNKELLRILYQEIIPDFVLRRKKQPGRTPWLELWDTEAAPYIGGPRPTTRQEAHKLIERWVIKHWLDCQL